MTRGRAALVVLMNRYLCGLVDPALTLLDVQKLLCLMQEAGEPLRLRFARASHGPFAENLRHVLQVMEGHFICGYQGGENAPDRQLELVPGAVRDAEAFLASAAATRERVDRVGKRVEGFETPFGLELLATVHWVAMYEDASSVEDATAKIDAWNERKQRFSKRQIGIAYETLRSDGWLKAA